MLLTLLVVLLTQVPCTPGEMSVVCNCKQGMVNACVTLAGDDPLKAAEVLDEVVGMLEALEQTSQMAREGDKNRKKQLQATAESLSHSLGSSEPPHCKGQEHHPISRRIARELENHATLNGLFKPRDPRFVARAKDEQAHCGYQEWHRKVDDEVIEWLTQNGKATYKEFMNKLREIYSRPEMRMRFPNGF
ncbi:Wall-associated protein precursor [Archangium violaceum]|uniref:Wall-associated protein precursor n=1 Tax=Archangium violaceum TaxID=83451 RepID=UPI002B2A3CC9|nr:Wall-associated protein precursor [Archangium violaceum]